MAHTWRPRPKGGTFCRLKSKWVGISLVVVYERVGKAVQSVKGPNRRLTEGFCGCGGDKKTSWFGEYFSHPVGGKSRNRTILVTKNKAAVLN